MGRSVMEFDHPPSVGVVGAGWMGRQIAAACLGRGLAVTLSDASPATLEGAMTALAAGTSARRLLRRARAARDLGTCDVLVETVVEDEGAKRAVLSGLEAVARPGAVIVSNTSGLPISRLAAGLRRPERFCGLHFCHPMEERRLAEVVPGPATSTAALSAVIAFARRLRRVSLVVPDGPGFLLNRLLVPYLNAALEQLVDGVGLVPIEAAAREAGMPVGPFTFLDEVGLDTAAHVGATLFRAYPDRVRPSGLLVALMKAGHLGRKSGTGFFSWSAGGATGESPALARLLGEARRTCPASNEIISRLLLPLAEEAELALRDGTAFRPRAVTAALRHGVGFRGVLPGSSGGRRSAAA